MNEQERQYPFVTLADIGSNWYDEKGNHIQRIKDIIYQVKECGINAIKFQNFRAEKIVSKRGFEKIGKIGHQKNWDLDVFETYQKYSMPLDLIPIIADECKKVKLDFISTPYDLEMVDALDKYVEIFKIGSGDIDYLELLDKIASRGKLVLLGTGASNIQEVILATNFILNKNPRLCLMQCTTRYDNSNDILKDINTNVLKSYKCYFPNVMLGLSDHSRSIYPCLSALGQGAIFFEKHFTLGNSKSPDNELALTPNEWKYLITAMKEFYQVQGNTFKELTFSEKDSVIVQRRCLRASKDLPTGHIITKNDIEVLRPIEEGSIMPFVNIIGMKLKRGIISGDAFKFEYLEK